MAPPLLVTPRLRVSAFVPADYPAFRELHSDPEVNRFLSPGPVPMSEEECQRRFTSYMETHARYGFGKWKVETHGGEFIGRAGFNWYAPRSCWDLGYTLKRAAWGQGFASELAAHLIPYFFANADDDVLMAFADTTHTASLRILRKSGFRFDRNEDVDGVPCSFFEIFRADAKQHRRPKVPVCK